MEHRRGNPLLPIVSNGRSAATTVGAGNSIGASSSGGLGGGYARGRRSSAAALEGEGEEVRSCVKFCIREH
jgi:hypothetical protein